MANTATVSEDLAETIALVSPQWRTEEEAWMEKEFAKIVADRFKRGSYPGLSSASPRVKLAYFLEKRNEIFYSWKLSRYMSKAR